MKRLAFVLLPLLATAPAAAWLPHGSSGGASPSCPYADQASTDGCASAPGGLDQQSNFFTVSAPLSGQTYESSTFTASIAGGVMTVSGATGTPLNNAATHATLLGAGIPAGVYVSSFGTGTGGNGTYNLANASGLSFSGSANALYRPWWNVAGVDYGVGITTPVASHLDPATHAPSFCAYHATGFFFGGGPYLDCTASTPSTMTNLNLSGNSLTGFGHECVGIELENASTAAITLDNLYFENDANCPIGHTSITYTGIIYQRLPGTSMTVALTLQNSTVVGHGESSCCNEPGGGGASGDNVPSGGLVGWYINTVGQDTLRNNAFYRFPGHIYGIQTDTSGTGNILLANNFFNTTHQRAPQGHSEFGSFQGSPNVEQSSYNVFFDDGTHSATFAALLVGLQSAGQVTSFQADHNTMIANLTPGATQATYTATPTIINDQITFTGISAGGAPLSGQGFQGSSDIFLYQCTGSGTSASCSYDCGVETVVSPATQWCGLATSSVGTYNANSGQASPGVSPGPTTILSTTGGENIALLHGVYVNSPQVLDNFIDSTGSGSNGNGVAYWSRAASDGCNAQTMFSGNIDMLTGNTLTGWAQSPGGGC